LTKPGVLEPGPPTIMAAIGGIVGLILFLATLYLAPTLGLAFVDLPRILGGIVTPYPDVAFWIGIAGFLPFSIIVTPAILAFLWTKLPGPNVGFLAAAFKGLLWGLALWVVEGVLLGIGGALSRIPVAERPPAGLFGLSAGLSAPIVLLVAHLVYGLAKALITGMTYGVQPISTLGFQHILHADARPVMLSREGFDIPEEVMGRGMP
jgi:hypothetical protein